MRNKIFIIALSLLILTLLVLTINTVFGSRRFREVEVPMEGQQRFLVQGVAYGKKIYLPDSKSFKDKMFRALPEKFHQKIPWLSRNLQSTLIHKATNKTLVFFGRFNLPEKDQFDVKIKNEKGETMTCGVLMGVGNKNFGAGYLADWPGKSKNLEIQIWSRQGKRLASFRVWNPAYLKEDILPVFTNTVQCQDHGITMTRAAHVMINGFPSTELEFEFKFKTDDPVKLSRFRLQSFGNAWGLPEPKLLEPALKTEGLILENQFVAVPATLRMEKTPRGTLFVQYIGSGFIWSDEPQWRFSFTENEGSLRERRVELSFPGSMIVLMTNSPNPAPHITKP